MKPFYLTKNAQGYYRAVFFNQQTGVCVKTKSTHTKDKMEAMLLAAEWYKNGTPDGYTNSRKKADDDVSVSGLNLDGIVKRLSQAEAVLLVSLISQKFNLNINIAVATADPTPQVAATAVVVAPTPSFEAPKKKVVVVHKKNALSDSGMIPADVAAKVYEPLNPECTMKLCEFLVNFWTPEKSEYIQNKRAHKKTIGDYHCKEMRGMVNRYWLPFFGEDFTVGELTEQYLEDFLQELANFRCLKGATINHARTCGATGLKWLKNKGIIHSNPMANVEAFSKSDATPRGIPDEKEIKALYELDWNNEVMYLAFNLSAFSGLRPGEISGLQVRDIDSEKDLITIRHSWHRTGFLKSTKTNLIRKVPVAHNIILRLLVQAQRCPGANEETFVFWSKANDYKPFLPQYYDDGFFEALHKIGVSEEERKERNIDFYSLRHFCATYLANMTDMRNVQAVLGHTTPAMTKHYANHMTDEHFDSIRDIFEQCRMSIIQAAA
ncbi:MAG: site-specific integrase [Spirochaetia bacterium]|nr:site-specific integrase [Spirochaetia bacterium]MDY5818173.1 site-specific integrase [Treponema sp.]